MVQYTFLHQFGPACLHRKIVLRKGHLWLPWVAILRNKVAGIARQHIVIYLTLSTFSQTYHFADVSKMVCCFLPCILTCGFAHIFVVNVETGLFLSIYPKQTQTMAQEQSSFAKIAITFETIATGQKYFLPAQPY